jgi:hypothetical protein
MKIPLKGPHQARTVGYLGLYTLAGWQLKLYGIAWQGERPRHGLVEAAKRIAERELPSPAWHTGASAQATGESDRYGLGFCIMHDARDFCFVLINWWAGENEIHQRMFSAPLDSEDRLMPHASDAIGCVWELAVTDFERRAWLRHVLANPGGANVEAYLQASFAGRL